MESRKRGGKKMRRIVLGLVAAVAVGMAAPRGARACGHGGGGYSGLYVALGAVAVAGIVDAGLTLWDGGSALASHHPSMGYGIFELIFAAPQLGLATYGALNRSSSDSSFFDWYALWMAGLTAHAVWTIVTAEPPSPSRKESPWARPTRRWGSRRGRGSAWWAGSEILGP
jgi:hypothetical protein